MLRAALAAQESSQEAEAVLLPLSAADHPPTQVQLLLAQLALQTSAYGRVRLVAHGALR